MGGGGFVVWGEMGAEVRVARSGGSVDAGLSREIGGVSPEAVGGGIFLHWFFLWGWIGESMEEFNAAV